VCEGIEYNVREDLTILRSSYFLYIMCIRIHLYSVLW